ncbi:MAG: penicillin-binding protein 2, partial [Actinomycetota bacterium]|nr:penicillin-binding protein 2 [Actinomycetota bacterium]
PRLVAGCARAVARARPGRRLSAMLALYLVLTLLLGWRLLSVQVIHAGQYQGLAARQTRRQVELPATRGTLYDRSGDPLAMSVAAATVYADPHMIAEAGADPRRLGRRLAPVLDAPRPRVERLLRQDTGFVYLARQVPNQVGSRVAALGLPGIGVLEEPARVYPAGPLAAQVVGYVGTDYVGLSGMELQYDDVLAGRSGLLRLEEAPGGLEITSARRQVRPPQPGRDLVLTLDREVQFATETALRRAVDRYRADGGSAVVLDARTGEVLAMASTPGYRPEDIDRADEYARRNRVVTDVFEPGSVNKVITGSAALEEGVVTPRTRMMVPDRLRVADKEFTDSHSHPPEAMSFADIIAESSNIGTIKVAQRLGPQRLAKYLRRFGYGRPTGLGFPGESAGIVADVADWWGTSLPTIAIGQGVSASLLQVAGVFQTVASGGERVEPTLVRGSTDGPGRLDPAPEPERRRVVSRRTAEQMARLLVGVVERGTGTQAAVPGYRVAGKTGTAKKPSETTRGYEAGAYIGTFAGFAPAEDPDLVVAVALDEAEVIYGGVTAAPVFSEVMSFALAHRRVEPSRPVEAVAPGGGWAVAPPAG